MVSMFVAVAAIPALFVVGSVGNILSAVVFYKQGLNIRINVCLFALALADQATITVLFFSYFEAAYRHFVGESNIFIKYFVGKSQQFFSVRLIHKVDWYENNTTSS
jgi:hypothetical protein